MDSKKDIKSLNLEELKTELESMGEKAFRAKQMYEWMHVKLARSFDEMTNLSAKFREQCKEKYEYTCVKPVRIQESKIDGTKKFLFELSDGNVVESVWMQYKHGNSVCISSQVGCRMGCRFCASTLDGLERNLTPSEMLDQIYAITRLTQERVSNVVVMGTGEPMDNYDNILKFLHLLTDENGLNISQRNVTVSTCGIVPRMRQLADEKLQITLALSLHATTDEKRRKLMPIANRYSIKELMEVCRYYFEQTGRRITFEYSLERVSNVVVMGTGEPMDNYDNILKFLHLLTDENGLNISQRNVTVSTCGIVPRMRQLADEKLQITLALSLHATTDEKRRKLMPIANRYSIKELMEVCRYYFEQTGRRITFEYSLVGGVNDTEEDAKELIALAKPLCCHINLIPVNPIKERDFVQSDTGHIQAFKNKLESKKIHVTIRREMGRDIDGACGQLRRRHTQEMQNPDGLSQEEN